MVNQRRSRNQRRVFRSLRIESMESRRLLAGDAGHTMATAANLGELNDSHSLRGRVDFFDQRDVFRFELSTRGRSRSNWEAFDETPTSLWPTIRETSFLRRKMVGDEAILWPQRLTRAFTLLSLITGPGGERRIDWISTYRWSLRRQKRRLPEMLGPTTARRMYRRPHYLTFRILADRENGTSTR